VTDWCGERSTVAEILEVVELARISPYRAKRRVILFDELHNLSARASEGLLAVTERPPRLTTFILMTSKLDKIPDSIRTRLTAFDLKPFDKAASLEFLCYICGQEQMSYEAQALSLLAHVIPGSPRWLLRSLDRLVSDERKITEQMVRDEFDLDVIAPLQSLVGAVLRNERETQFEVLDSWRNVPEKKLEFLQSLFGFVYFDHVLHIRSKDPVLRGFDSGLAARLSDRVSECAMRLNLTEDQAWQNLTEILNPQDRVTDTRLKMTVVKLSELLADELQGPRKVERRPKRHNCVFRADSGTVSQAKHLSWKSARDIWNAASFLTQHYGEVFNVRAAIHHGNGDGLTAAEAASDFTRRLHMRLQEWSCDKNVSFHWLWVREQQKDGSLVSRLALALPEVFQTKAKSWVASRFVSRRDPRADRQLLWRARNDREDDIRFHWNAVRSLLRGLDPGVLARDRDLVYAPIADLLSIPAKWRAISGVGNATRERGSSHSLGPGKQRRGAELMPFLSAIDDGAWKFTSSGWEKQEFRDRNVEMNERLQAQKTLRVKFTGSGHFVQARLDEELRALQDALPRCAKIRRRSWRGWWR
jgi:DNA polymerase-3 subunit gamma/tau